MRTTGIFCRPSAAPDMLCGKTSPSTQMQRGTRRCFAPANVVSQTKPMPSNIGWIKLPTPVDCWNRKACNAGSLSRPCGDVRSICIGCLKRLPE
ncbi:hypothetical protein [Escherichia coli]|uniref:hypothetical protein n=1 Tax=Escherichia coli TaxID=562 RepID=UPI003D9A3034